MGFDGNIKEILYKQSFAQLPTTSTDKKLAFVEDDLTIYAYNQQGGNAGHMGTNWFVVGSSTPFGGYMIFVTPGTNNKATDAATFGADWPSGDESFTIQDGIAAAEAFGGGTVWGIGTGFVINNPARNNQILMRPNVQLKWGSVGCRVRTRDTGVDSAEPQGGIVMFSHPDFWDAIVNFTSLTLDAAGKPGDGSEDGMYISRIELDAGQVAANSVVVDGLIVYAGRTRRISAIDGDTVFFDSPVGISDVAGAPLSADYLPPTYVIYNSSIGDFTIEIGANAWVTSYYGVIAGYGSYWCEVGEVKYAGSEIDTAVPANDNLPVEGGFITAYFCYDWRVTDVITDNYPFKAWHGFNCDAFDLRGPRFGISPGPNGFDATSPTACFTMQACDEWKLDDLRISVIVSAATAGTMIGNCVGSGNEKIYVSPTCEFYQAGMDAGVAVVFSGLQFSNMSNLEMAASVIAGDDPTGAPTVNTLNLDHILKAKITGRLRAAGHLDKTVPATLRNTVSILKADYNTSVFGSSYLEGADEVAAPGSPAAPLYVFAGGGSLRLMDCDYRQITLAGNGGLPTHVNVDSGKGAVELDLAHVQRLVIASSFSASLADLIAKNVYVVITSTAANFKGNYENCAIAVEGTPGGTLTVDASMRDCQLNIDGGEIATLAISGGNYVDVTNSGSLLDLTISGGKIARGSWTSLSGATGGEMRDALLTLLNTAITITLSNFAFRGGEIAGGGGNVPVLDMASNSIIDDATLSGQYDITVGGAARNGVYFMQNKLHGTGTATIPAAATAKTWAMNNEESAGMTVSDLSAGTAQVGGNA